ncbi:MAG: DMT family transporter [Bacteroidia bacterium]
MILDKKIGVHLALFIVALSYAGNFSFAKWAMPEYISAYAFIVLRVGAGMLFFVAYYFLFNREKISDKSDYLKLAIAAFFGVSLNMTAFFKGLSMTSAINASVLMLLAPVFVVIFNAIGYKKNIKPLVYLGIVVAFIGAALLVDVVNFSFSDSGVWGDLLVMLNATSYAFYLFYVTRLLKKYKATTITMYLFIFGFIYVLPIGARDLLLVEWRALPTKAVFAMGYVIAGITILAYLLNAWALQNSNSTTVGSYIYLQPLLATLIAVSLGMDHLTWDKLAFGLLIVLGLWLVNKGR